MNVAPLGGYEILDLVRRSGSTKQKSDLMMTLAQVTVGGRVTWSLVSEIDGKWGKAAHGRRGLVDSMDVGVSGTSLF